jgi:short-subunit dehydrogenase
VIVSSYAASTRALEEWSESLRLEVNSLGIQVVRVARAAFHTKIWARGAVLGEQATKGTAPNIQRSKRMRERITDLPNADPIAVAELIVGRHAEIQLAMKRILSWKWREKLVANLRKID